MRVESFDFLERDVDARYANVTDPNDRKKKCAIIKVVTTEMDCAFDNGQAGIVKVEKHPQEAEVWVYVPVNTKMIKITHPRHGQLNTDDGYFYFPEKCKSACVYRLKLYTEFHPDEDIIKDEHKFATVAFKVYPLNAKVILRKLPEVTDAYGRLEKTMPLGTYHYRVSADDYYYVDGQFELTDEGIKKEVNIQLRQAFGWAVLPPDFDKTDCKFSVGGKYYSLIDSKIAMPNGKHKLHIEKRYYHPMDVEISIEDSVCTNINPVLKPILGKLMVNTPEQPGSTIKVDGRDFGVTPFEGAQELIIGNHTIEITRPSYVSQTREVEIKENTTENINVFLTSLGNFNITTTPTGASLYINNKYIGVTPCSMNELASGDYDLKIEKKKYHTYKKNVHFDAASPNNIFKLKYQYQQKNQIYIQPTFQTIAYNSVGVGLGGYINNINVEADYFCGLKSENIFWDYNGEKNEVPRPDKLKSMWVGGKAGYGFVMGNRLRFTPQIGVGCLLVKGEESKCYALNASAGLSIGFAIVKNLGIVLSPEYCLPIVKSDTYSRIADVSKEVKNWSNGFNLRIGINICM